MRPILILLLIGSTAVPVQTTMPIAQCDDKKEDASQRETMLKAMRTTAMTYSMSIGERRLKLIEDPIMRFSNPQGVSKDGAIFVWTDNGRPQALFKIYKMDGETFGQEWQSLSEQRLRAERDGTSIWTPAEPGVAFREVPDAPKPAATSAERLRQMKKLSEKFQATYMTTSDRNPNDLRLLVQPLYRYEPKEDPRCIDGALFGFAQSTTPMTILQMEAHRINGAERWHYAIARFSSGAMTVRLGDKEVFSVDRYNFNRDPNRTFLALPRQPIPKE